MAVSFVMIMLMNEQFRFLVPRWQQQVAGGDGS